MKGLALMVCRSVLAACAVVLTTILLPALAGGQELEERKTSTTANAGRKPPAMAAPERTDKTVDFSVPRRPRLEVEAGSVLPERVYWRPTEAARARVARPAQTAGDPHIADNSFLIEEAYNQEYGVVQHINAFQRGRRGDWEFTFTQEWPVQPAPRHQFSYTLAVADYETVPGAGGGLGDLLLNYRYQLAGQDGGAVAIAPRISLLLPTGDSRQGRGAGGTGVEFNLPVSITLHEQLVTHFNAGGSIVPNAKNPAGEEAATYGYFVGQSFIWRLHPRFNPLLEVLFSSQQSVAAPGDAVWENSVILNPGFRWAYNFANGLQIVPGIAFPVEVGRANRGEWGIFLYLSFEHPFAASR
ncbi:MAG: hypothetical protein K6U09_02800 [Acidobacteriia bacterium]|jgi:hypothetical protein|nr:hypothetical protein [Terriglobia bacterium]